MCFAKAEEEEEEEESQQPDRAPIMDFYNGGIPIMNPIMDFHVLSSLNSFVLGGVLSLLFLFAHIYSLGLLLPSLFSRGEAKQDKARWKQKGAVCYRW